MSTKYYLLQYVTGFAKTFHVHTRIEIHFIAYYNSHTHAIFRHNNKIGIDKHLLLHPVKSWRTIIDPVRPLWGINWVAWGPILFLCMSTWLMVWSGLLWPSVWPTVHTIWSLVSNSIINPPSTSTPSHPLTPFMWHSWYCRLFSKHLSKPASLTSSYICKSKTPWVLKKYKANQKQQSKLLYVATRFDVKLRPRNFVRSW